MSASPAPKSSPPTTSSPTPPQPRSPPSPPPPSLALPILLLLSTTVLLGTLYSLVHRTWHDTSSPLLTAAPVQIFFANRKNFVNQLFVKRAWGWTTAAALGVLLSLPAGRKRDARVLVVRWALSTVFWAGFTTWFFGPSFMERVLLLTGGQCVLPSTAAPPPSPLDTSPASPPLQTLTLLPPHHCRPDSLLPPEYSSYSSRPRFTGGHDVSGHTYLLIHASTFLLLALAPSLPLLFPTLHDAAPRWFPRRRSEDERTQADRVNPAPPRSMFLGPATGALHLLAVKAALALSALWWWMLLMTAVFFHNPLEKFTGVLVAYAAVAFTLMMG